LSRGRDHPRRQVETNDALDLSSKESRDMDWAATDVGDPRGVMSQNWSAYVAATVSYPAL